MNINEMHAQFRVLAQQVGMEAVRAILPEEIDRFLNKAIIDLVREIVNNNTSTNYRDRITLRTNTISPFNSLRTLYKVIEVNGNSIIQNFGSAISEYDFIFNSHGVMFVTDIGVRYTKHSSFTYYCRFIEPERWYQSQIDFCNSPSFDYPIVSLIEDENNVIKIRFANGNYEEFIPKVFTVGIIKQPIKVSVVENISSDLPEHIHSDVVTAAVRLFESSVNRTHNNVR